METTLSKLKKMDRQELAVILTELYPIHDLAQLLTPGIENLLGNRIANFMEYERSLADNSTFLEDFKIAMTHYITKYVTLEIRNLSFTGVGTDWNVTDTFKFKCFIRNNGPIDMKNLSLRVSGSHYAKLRPTAEIDQDFRRFFDVTDIEIDANNTWQSIWIEGRCEQPTNGESTGIVHLSINSWDASLQHLLKDLTKDEYYSENPYLIHEIKNPE